MFASAEDQGLYPAEDYALYDRIWQRVSPELDPYPEIRAAAQAGAAVSPPPQPVLERREQADSADDLERLMGEELAGSQHCLALARRTRNAAAQRLLCRIAGEKRAAVHRLETAYFLAAGVRCDPRLTVEPTQWDRLTDGLRSCYQQEIRSAQHCRQAAKTSGDPCLCRLLAELERQALDRAAAGRALLENVLR